MIHVAGIIAAGEGTRLREAGVPKPLVPVAGRPLVHWTVLGLQRAGVKTITVLHNSIGGGMRAYLRSAFPGLQWRFLQKDTPSSWASFRLVAGILSQTEDKFLMSTVDAVADPAETSRFAGEAEKVAAAVAVTPFIDDENPLWTDLDDEGWVAACGDAAVDKKYATCGLYSISNAAFLAAQDQPFPRLRDFWAGQAGGRRLKGVVLKKTVDVDRPADVTEAERFLQELSLE